MRALLSGDALADLLYAVAAAVPFCSGPALQQLFRLLPTWRVVPRSALAARSSLVAALLQASAGQLQAALAAHDAAGSGGSVGYAGATPAATAAACAVGHLQMAARAHLRPPEAWLALVVRCLAPQLSGMSAATASSVVLWLGLCGARLKGESAGQRHVLAASRALLPQATRSELVRLAYGCSRLGVVPGEAWLQAFYDRAVAAPGAFGPSGFGMVVWALARMGAAPPAAWMAAQLAASFELDGDGEDEALRNTAAADASGASHAAARASSRVAPRPQHLANMLCAFAKLGFSPGPRWMGWFRAALSGAAGQLQELDHFHIEWAWRELNNGGSRGDAGAADA